MTLNMDPRIATYVWISLHYEESFIPTYDPLLGAGGFYATIPFPLNTEDNSSVTQVSIEYAIRYWIQVYLVITTNCPCYRDKIKHVLPGSRTCTENKLEDRRKLCYEKYLDEKLSCSLPWRNNSKSTKPKCTKVNYTRQFLDVTHELNLPRGGGKSYIESM